MALATLAFFLLLLLGGAHPAPVTVKLRTVRQQGQRLDPGRWRSFGKEASSFEVSELGFGPDPLLRNASLRGPTLSLQLLTSPASATLELRNVNSLLYTADLDIGVAGRSARVVVDTGSADFWLKPNLLVEEVHGQKLVSASPRRQDVHGQLLVPEYLIRYGLGEVIAIPIVEERVCAGSLCLEQLELMLALKIQGVQEQGAFDGLAGLAFPPLQQAPTNQTLLQALQLRSGCAHFGFSLSLRGEGGQSLLSLGEVKDLVKAMEKAEGGSSIPVKVVSRDQDTEPGYWMVEVKMSVFNGKNQLLLAKGKGLLDSGSSFLAVPEGLVGYVVMALTYGHGGLPSLAVDESQRLLCRCDAGLNDLVFELPGEDGRTLRVNLTQDELLEPPTSTFSSYCALRLLVIPASANIPYLIIGDPLLRKVSVVFDVDGARVHVLPVGDKRGAALVAEGLAAGPPHELALLGLVCLLSTALAATCAWRCWWQGPGETGHYQYLAM